MYFGPESLSSHVHQERDPLSVENIGAARICGGHRALRLNGRPGGNFCTDARCSVTKKGESPAMWPWTNFGDVAEDAGYESFVRTHGKALGVPGKKIPQDHRRISD